MNIHHIKGKTVVLFHAKWCLPSSEMLKKIQSLPLNLLLVDVEKEPEFTRAMDIRAVPTIKLMNGAIEYGTLVGNGSLDAIKLFLETRIPGILTNPA